MPKFDKTPGGRRRPKRKGQAELELVLILGFGVFIWYMFTQVNAGWELLNQTYNLGASIVDLHIHTGLVVWYFYGLNNGYWIIFAYVLGFAIWWIFIKPKRKKLDTAAKRRAHYIDVASTIPLGLSVTSIVCVLVCLVFSFLPANYTQTVTQLPVMTEEEADRIRHVVNTTTKMSGWTRSRHRRYSTEDVPLSDVPEAYDAVLEIIDKRVRPFIFMTYGATKMEYVDLFYVRYSMEVQRFLAEHRDYGCVSLNIAISDKSEFEGGGTYFPAGIKNHNSDTVRISKGQALFHGSQIVHSGVHINSGERHIIVAFIKVYGGTEWYHTFGLTSKRIMLENLTTNPKWDGIPLDKDNEFWRD